MVSFGIAIVSFSAEVLTADVALSEEADESDDSVLFEQPAKAIADVRTSAAAVRIAVIFFMIINPFYTPNCFVYNRFGLSSTHSPEPKVQTKQMRKL